MQFQYLELANTNARSTYGLQITEFTVKLVAFLVASLNLLAQLNENTAKTQITKNQLSF